MSFWSKVKGVFGRIGSGIKTGANKAYNWITNNSDKIERAKDLINDVTNNKYADKISGAQNLYNKGVGYAKQFGIL